MLVYHRTLLKSNEVCGCNVTFMSKGSGYLNAIAMEE